MALVACKECKQQISDKAKICPHCGAKPKRTSPIIKFFLWFILICSLPGLFSALLSPSSTSPNRSTAYVPDPNNSKNSSVAMTIDKRCEHAERMIQTLYTESETYCWLGTTSDGSNKKIVIFASTKPILSLDEKIKKPWLLVIVGTVGHMMREEKIPLDRIVITDVDLKKSNRGVIADAGKISAIREDLFNGKADLNQGYSRIIAAMDSIQIGAEIASAIDSALNKKTEELAALRSEAHNAERAVIRTLRNPDSYKLSQAAANPKTGAVCLEYRAQNGFGGMNVGRIAFHKGDSEILDENRKGFAKIWKECLQAEAVGGSSIANIGLIQ